MIALAAPPNEQPPAEASYFFCTERPESATLLVRICESCPLRRAPHQTDADVHPSETPASSR